MPLEVNSGTSNYNLLPPVNPAEAGLSGAPAMATPPAQPEENTAPVVEGPATIGPANPGMSVARHIMAALGGSSGQPMDWAKGIISGGLAAAAANVGPRPRGCRCFVAARQRALRVYKNFNDKRCWTQRQAVLDASKLEDEKMQRTVWNAAKLPVRHNASKQAAELFKYAPAEHARKVARIRRPALGVCGKSNSRPSLPQVLTIVAVRAEIKNPADLTPEQKQGLMSHPPTLMAVPNGEPHDAGHDDVGVHLVPSGVLMNATLKKDLPISIPRKADDEGKPTTKNITIVAGTPVMDAAAAILQGAKNQVETKQKALLAQADVQQAINKNRSEELKNQPPPKDQLDTFVGKTLPGYSQHSKIRREWFAGRSEACPHGCGIGQSARTRFAALKLSAPIERLRKPTSERTKKRGR